MKRLQRGLTLLELLIAFGAAAMILVTLTASLSTAFDWQRRQPALKEARDNRYRFEDRMRGLLQRAYITSDEEDAAGYFIAEPQSGSGQFADSLVFTSIGSSPSGAYLDSDETDFQVLNERFGPQGGIEEVSLSLVPIGSSPSQDGLFLRQQRPADGDSTQGGWESLLDERIQEIQFELWDGTEWLGTWDTRNNQRRIPAAIRVSYRMQDDGIDRVFIVRLPNSDITTEDPLTEETEGGAEGQAQQ